MRESNGSPTSPSQNGATASCAAPPLASVNGKRPGVVPQVPAAEQASSEQPSAPPVEKVLDESLDEQDIKVSITLTVHGRKIDIMKRAFEKTFYDAFESPSRGMLFSAIKNFLEQEIYEAIAVKINRRVPYVMPEKPSHGQQQKGKVVRDLIPPYTGHPGENEEPEISLHEWPPMDDCLKVNRTNAR